MKAQSKFHWPWIIVIFMVFNFLTIGATSAESPQGFQRYTGPYLSTEESKIVFQEFCGSPQPLGGGGAAMGGEGADPEIIQLARGLKNDLDLIYKFVYDNIEFIPGRGMIKGPYMTLMDRSGTALDQASLLASLLEESDYEVHVVFGVIELSSEQISDWLGIENNNEVIERFLYSGFLLSPGQPGGGVFRLYHAWVKVNISGTWYVFDPSIKTYTTKTGRPYLQEEMGYNRTIFLDFATDGADVPPDQPYVAHLNKENLDFLMRMYSNKLIDEIKADWALDDIIGGRSIIPISQIPTIEDDHPYMYGEPAFDDILENIDPSYKPRIKIYHGDLPTDLIIDCTQIYGRRLTLTYIPDNKPHLRLDGDSLADGEDAVPPGSYRTTTIRVYYPGMSERVHYFSTKTGGCYSIVNGWLDVDKRIINKHRKKLKQYLLDGEEEDSEPVLGESFTAIALSWLAQSSLMERIYSQIMGVYGFNYYTVGVCGQEGGGPYIDLHGWRGIASKSSDFSQESIRFFLAAGHSSAFESGIYEQLQPTDAVSTVKLIDIANETYKEPEPLCGGWCKIYKATEDNWSTIRTELENQFCPTYEESYLDDVEDFLNNPDKDCFVFIPAYGDLEKGQYEGSCHIGMVTDVFSGEIEEAVYKIDGGYNGGYSAYTWPLLVPFVPISIPLSSCYDYVSLNSHFFSYDPIDMFTGSFTYDHSDLDIGSSESPFSLEFKRYYNSDSRLEEGSLGLGWTHSFDISAEVDSDGFQAMGADSPIDAAATIATIYVVTDLAQDIYSEQSLLNTVVVTLVQNWLMDQMINNTISIREPERTTQFVKLPDGTYNPPPGSASKLKVTGDFENCKLYTKDGVRYEFSLAEDENGKIRGNIGQIIDPHNNTIQFGYSSDKLDDVSNNFGRSLEFEYTGTKIKKIIDSAGRYIEFTYDGDNLETYEDVQENVTTYEYHPDNHGQLIQIFYPTAPDDSYVTNTYDDLGRVCQQENANNEVYDYYYAYYRTEEVQPEPFPGAGEASSIYFFDKNGNNTKTIDQVGNETEYEYDNHQRIKCVTYPAGNKELYSYDENHNITEVRKICSDSSQDDIVETFVYDSVTIVDVQLLRWFSQLKEYTDTTGQNTTTFKYDYNYGAEEPEYGQLGDLKEITYPEVDLPAGTGTYTPKIYISYNSYGQVAEVEEVFDYDDPVELTTKTKYDYYSPAHDYRGALKETIVDYGNLNITTTIDEYDSVGNVLTKTDPRGNQVTYEYYDNRLLKKTISPAPYYYVTENEYYPDDKIKLIKQQTDNLDQWQVTEYTYTPTREKETERGPVIKVAGNSIGDNDGAIYGGKWTDGKVNSALSFNGSSDYVDCGNESSLDITNEITISAWIKIADADQNRGMRVVSKKQNWYSSTGFELEYNPATNNLTLNGSGSNYARAISIDLDKEWHHVVGIINGTTGTLYVDGDDVTFDSSISSLASNSLALHIGKRTGGTDYFNGGIDEVIIFDRALIPPEIDRIYQNGLNGNNALEGFESDDYPISYWNFDEGQTNLIKYEYDSLDRLWKVTDAEGNITETLYYPDGKTWKVIDAENHDSKTYTYTENGDIDTITDAKGNTTDYDYDTFGRLETTIYPDDTFEQLTYEAATGRLLQKRNRAGQITSFIYDALNRVTTKTLPDTGTITYKYDLLDRVVNTTDYTGVIQNSYDNAGRLIGVTYPGEKSISYDYDAGDNRIRLTYPDSKFVGYCYDSLNRLVYISQDFMIEEVDPDDWISHWKFDKTTEDSVGENDGISAQEPSWTEGQFGYALSFNGTDDWVTVDNGDGGDFDFDNYNFTLVAWFKTNADSKGTLIGCRGGSDDYYRLDILSDGSVNFEFSTGSGSNDKQTITSSSGGYNNGEWHLAVAVRDGVRTGKLYIDDESPIIDNNPAGSATKIEVNSDLFIGKYADSSCYFNGLLDDIRIYRRDLLEQEVQQLYNQKFALVRYEYDALSQRVMSQYENGSIADYEYDFASRLTSLNNYLQSKNYKYDYTYDFVGNRLSMLVNDTDLHNYIYDRIYQLTDVNYPSEFFVADTYFNYDAAGNRQTVTEGWKTTKYTINNPLNQYDIVDQEAFDYDSKGNLTSDDMNDYLYDSQNRLIEVTNLNISYTYNPEGRRIEKEVDGKVTKYLYDGDQVIVEYDEYDRPMRKFVYGSSVDEPVKMITQYPKADVDDDGDADIDDVIDIAAAWLTQDGEGGYVAEADLDFDGKINNSDLDILAENWGTTGERAEQWYYYHFDGLGSCIALTDSQGNIVERYRYGVYGRCEILGPMDSQKRDKSSYGNPYMFTSRRFDPETGLYYYRARVYNPYIGRFMQTDPIGYEDGMNLYTYVGNGPVNLVDPSGLWRFTIGGAFGIGGLITFGKNEGQWSVSVNLGFGYGAIGSYDSANTGASITGSGGGAQMNLTAMGQIPRAISGGYSGTTNVGYGTSGFGFDSDYSMTGQLHNIGGSAHYNPYVNLDTDELSLTKHSFGATTGAGGLVFVGVGGHGQWGGTNQSDSFLYQVDPEILNASGYGYYPLPYFSDLGNPFSFLK